MLNDQIDISIIVPVFKAETFINRCVDSILAQSFSNFELILIDDGSPDRCPEICDEYSKKDKRIRVIHKTNAGVSAARNTGIKVAKGKWLMFCDSDDYVSSNWCEKMYNSAIMFPNSWIVSNIFSVDKNNNCHVLIEKNIESKDLDYKKVFDERISGAMWNKIFSRIKIINNKIQFDENMSVGEDVLFNVEYFEKCCNSITYIHEPLYFYNENLMSTLHSYHENWFLQHLQVFWIRLPLIKENQLNDYCDKWLCTFISMFDYTFDKRNTISFIKKMHYNQKMIKSKEFRFCLENATCKNENPLIINILNRHNYYVYWLFQKIVNLKKEVLGEKI